MNIILTASPPVLQMHGGGIPMFQLLCLHVSDIDIGFTAEYQPAANPFEMMGRRTFEGSLAPQSGREQTAAPGVFPALPQAERRSLLARGDSTKDLAASSLIEGTVAKSASLLMASATDPGVAAFEDCQRPEDSLKSIPWTAIRQH
jgi:hypothetical protein